jgi:hypothetical protein
MQFEITNPKPLNKNTLRGFFTLKAGPLEIEGYTYHIKNDKTWINPPSREYRDKESNEVKYAPVIRIPDKDRYWKFQEWACAECEELFASAPEKESKSF